MRPTNRWDGPSAVGPIETRLLSGRDARRDPDASDMTPRGRAGRSLSNKAWCYKDFGAIWSLDGGSQASSSSVNDFGTRPRDRAWQGERWPFSAERVHAVPAHHPGRLEAVPRGLIRGGRPPGPTLRCGTSGGRRGRTRPRPRSLCPRTRQQSDLSRLIDPIKFDQGF